MSFGRRAESEGAAMNNEVRNRDGKVIGYECFTCGGMFQRMWGTVCNECRDKERRHQEILAAMRRAPAIEEARALR